AALHAHRREDLSEHLLRIGQSLGLIGQRRYPLGLEQMAEGAGIGEHPRLRLANRHACCGHDVLVHGTGSREPGLDRGAPSPLWISSAVAVDDEERALVPARRDGGGDALLAAAAPERARRVDPERGGGLEGAREHHDGEIVDHLVDEPLQKVIVRRPLGEESDAEVDHATSSEGRAASRMRSTSLMGTVVAPRSLGSPSLQTCRIRVACTPSPRRTRSAKTRASGRRWSAATSAGEWLLSRT